MFTISSDLLGAGTYGKVYKGTRTATGEPVAIKCFKAKTDEDGIDVGVLRELVYLKSMSLHPNVIQLYDVEWTGSKIRVSMPLYKRDLAAYVKGTLIEVPTHVVIGLSTQLLRGLEHLHKHGIFHRDIKPGNLLLDEANTTLVICDFSLASNFVDKLDHSQTIQTLWYRAPEILLGSKRYAEKVDIWSFGCVVGMLLSKKDLFPGDCDIGQLYKIFQVVGTPTMETWPGIEQLPHFATTWPSWRPTKLDSRGHLQIERWLVSSLVCNPDYRATATELAGAPAESTSNSLDLPFAFAGT